MVNLPEVAVVPYGSGHLLVRWEGERWVNIESGLEYGPTLPAGSEHLTRAVENPDGELCSELALAHSALRDSLAATAEAWRALARTLRDKGTIGNIAAGVAYDVAAGDVTDALLTDANTLMTAIAEANTRARARATETDGG